MTKRIKAMAVAFISALAFSSSATLTVDLDANEDAQFKENQARAMATVQFMNYLNYVVYTLSTYKNVFVIEEEYKKVSPSSLDLRKIPDPEVKKAIDNLLKTIRGFKVDDTMKDRFLKAQEVRAQQAKEEMWKKMLTSFFTDGVAAGRESYGETMAELGNEASRKAVSLALASNVPLAIGKACAGQVIGSYLDYQRTQAELQQRSAEYKFNYDMSRDEKMHEENIKQLELQYTLIQKYKINDRVMRVTEENVKRLISKIKMQGSASASSIFQQLKSMLTRNSPYRNFPIFWYYYSAFAIEAEEYEEAVSACESFEKANRYSIFRDDYDPMPAKVAQNKITAMVSLGRVDRTSISNSLETIKRYNYASENVDMDYFCATIYSSVLHDPQGAINVLNPLICNLEANYNKSLVSYRDLVTKEAQEIELQENSTPISTDLFRCHKLMKDILCSTKNDSYGKVLRQICSRSTTASIEKLYFIGETRVDDLWKLAKQDVAAISLQYVVKSIENEFELYVPLQWFALGELDISVDLCTGTKTLKQVFENRSKRRIVKRDDAPDRVFVRTVFACRAKHLKAIDRVVVKLPHASWPVEVDFCPQSGVSVIDAQFSNDVSPYVPTEVRFMGKSKLLVEFRGNANPKSFEDLERNESLSNRLIRHTLPSWYSLGTAPIYGAYATAWEYGSDYVKKYCGEKGFDKWLKNTLPDCLSGETSTFVLPYSIREIQLQTNHVVSVVISNMNYFVAYTNATPARTKLKIKMTTFTPFGAQLCEQFDEFLIKPSQGGIRTLYWPSELRDCATPYCLLFEVTNNRGIKEKGWDYWDRLRERNKD